MDVFILGNDFRNSSLLERFSSFIWTERYQEAGDCEIVISETDDITSQLQIGSYIGLNRSYRVMRIDTRERTVNEAGEYEVKYKGTSLESVFKQRSIRPSVRPTYTFSDKPLSSTSTEKYGEDVTRRNYLHNPMFYSADGVLPVGYDNYVRGASNTGTVSTRDGRVTLGNVTIANTVSGSIFGICLVMPYAYSITKNIIYTTLSDLSLPDNARAGVYVDFRNASNTVIATLESYYSGGMTTRVTDTVPDGITGAASSLDIYFWIDNGPIDGNILPGFTQASATFSSPMLTDASSVAVSDQYFDGFSSWVANNPKEYFTGEANTLIDTMVSARALNNTRAPWENLSIVKGAPVSLPIFTTGVRPGPTEITTLEFESVSLYDAVTDTAANFDMGFYILRNPSTGQLYYNSYAGIDRTVNQTVTTPVVFSQELGTLTDIEELSSRRDEYTFAQVYGQQDMLIVDAMGDTTTHTTVTGFDRKMLVVKASDIDLPYGTEELRNALIQRGRSELAKHQLVESLDGEVPSNPNYVYGVDYIVGAMVTMRSDSGVQNDMRVSEYIFVSDENGDREYPTLLLDKRINPGSWSSVNPGTIWESAEGDWAEW